MQTGSAATHPQPVQWKKSGGGAEAAPIAALGQRSVSGTMGGVHVCGAFSVALLCQLIGFFFLKKRSSSIGINQLHCSSAVPLLKHPPTFFSLPLPPSYTQERASMQTHTHIAHILVLCLPWLMQFRSDSNEASNGK